MKQALELALEALETPWNAPYVDGCDLALGKRVKAITAIKEALAQPERDYERGFIDGMQKQMQSSVDKAVNAMSRTWVGLTDEEIQECLKGLPTQTIDVYARRIEAKLKEKNNG